MSILKKLAITAAIIPALTACSGTSQQATFNTGCKKVFAEESEDADLVSKFCSCMYDKFSEELSKEDMTKLTTLFAESETERGFMNEGRERFGEDKFRDLGRTADTCDPDDL